jgi:short-subunit dehydrogenase
VSVGRRSVEVVGAISQRADLVRAEGILRSDSTITVLVNNAGVGATGSLLKSDVDAMGQMIALSPTPPQHRDEG